MTKTNSWENSPTLGTKRLNEPPTTISKARQIGRAGIVIGDRPFLTYAVLDSFPVSCERHTYTAILCREADADLLATPGVEPIACFVPIPGRGTYGYDTVRPSVLFWRDQFWIPLWSMEEQREDIAKHLYGEDVLEDHTFDILHTVEVEKIPDVDLLQLRTLEQDA
jgi:hypothetical protein